MKQLILDILAYFHKPFAKMMPFQTFRYLVCGGGNTAMDIFLYFISFNFILHQQMVHLPFFTISPHIAAFLMAFVITFPTGFLLNKYIVFSESNLRGRVQLIRYLLLVGICFLFNVVFIKLFVDYCHFYPTIAKILTTILVVCFSYITQKKFTFKVKVQN
ncbi:GtrA family protein [Chitinophaga sp. SYP-B3965]|jgi:putative flippase GtrA|uniref:GtrA family protein n=1 Tax=Chitinophaga sp. SYP-B3965 TaxID=2663120 RepID=UPI0012999F65|nr:GtrA family protein [Chitinophaga sp. SYP-B3965]MRG48232.1 GtrA family protein [Chitinophaga sp. SYP-B3965]